MRPPIASILLAAAIVISPLSSRMFAQDNPPQSEQREAAIKRLAALQERLKLTPEQKQQVIPIFREEMQEKKAVRDEYGDPRDAKLRTKLKMSRKIKSIESDTDKKLSPILSPEQMKELKQFRAEVKEEIKEGM